MFRLLKTNDDGAVDILSASNNEEDLLSQLCDYVSSNASNGDEYTSCDFDTIIENKQERIGSYIVEVDEVSLMSENDFISSGGVCIYCHSDDVEPGSLFMEDGFVSRELTCNICNSTTTEQYNLSGYEE